MRLIDADALKMNFPHDEDWDYPVNTNQYVSEVIDEAPTVEAIPVEWIEQHFGSLRIAQMIIESWRAENAV